MQRREIGWTDWKATEMADGVSSGLFRSIAEIDIGVRVLISVLEG